MSTSIQTLLGGGAALNPIFRMFTVSGFFGITIPGVYDVFVFGAGGSGAVHSYGNNGGAGALATGGGGGGFFLKRVTLAVGTYSATIGAGGAPAVVAGNSSVMTAAGVAGGDTIFESTSSSTTVFFNAAGGRGGVAGTNLATLAGGLGGTYTSPGADMAVTGGQGGSIAGATTGVAAPIATGGGAPGNFLRGFTDGGHGGNTTAGVGIATGGAGAGNSGVSQVSPGVTLTGGGGAGGTLPAGTLILPGSPSAGPGGQDIFGNYGFSLPDLGNPVPNSFLTRFELETIFNFVSCGGYGLEIPGTGFDASILTRRLPPGSGSGGTRCNTVPPVTGTIIKSLDAGAFAGTGGFIAGAGGSFGSGNAGTGGGSGGVAGVVASGNGPALRSGMGGNGLIMLRKVA